MQPAPVEPVAVAPAQLVASPPAPSAVLPNEVATLPVPSAIQPQPAQLVPAGGALPMPVAPSPAAQQTATAAPAAPAPRAAAPIATAPVAAPPAVPPNVVTPVLPAIDTPVASTAAAPAAPVAPWSPAPLVPSRRGRHRSAEEEPDEAPLDHGYLDRPTEAPVHSGYGEPADQAPRHDRYAEPADQAPLRSGYPDRAAEALRHSGYRDEPVREPLSADTCAMPRVRPEVELSTRAASRTAGHVAVRELPPPPSSSWDFLGGDAMEPIRAADQRLAATPVLDEPAGPRTLADTTAPWEADVPSRTADMPTSTAPLAPQRPAATPAPAPWSDDSTLSMPPLTLLPPRTARPSWVAKPPVLVRRAEPAPVVAPVQAARPPVRRPAASQPADRLAMVTRLMDGRRHDLLCHAAGPSDLVPALRALGLPAAMLEAGLAADARTRGAYSALHSVLDAHLPALPQAPTGPGDVLAVVGPGSEALVTARALAHVLGLDSDQVLWATPGELACLTPHANQVTSSDGARLRRQAGSSTATIVAIDAPLRSGRSTWVSQMLDVWAPTAVWGALDATRKPGDLSQWLRSLPRLDAIAVSDTDASTDPAAVLTYAPVPVALLDGVPATAHRWATLLCERLEGAGT